MIRLLRAVFCLNLIASLGFCAGIRDVVINEIAWMGTSASTYDEWIELFNTTGSTIDLSGWTLSSTDGDPTILLSGTIVAYGYFLLERTDDTAIKNIPADQIYSGSLSNTGEYLELRDSENQVIDEVDGWSAGDNTTKSSMERICCSVAGSQTSNWGTNDGITKNGLDASDNPLNATPKALNSVNESSLSVGLSSFTAESTQKSIVLNWITESEVNSYGFNVYRSEFKEGPFEKVNCEIIFSKGNSTTRETYQYIDVQVNPGCEYWYRLSEVDQNGIETFYGMIHVLLETNKSIPGNTGLLPNYPNPFNPSTVIAFQIGAGQNNALVKIEIVDILGSMVREVFQGHLGSGNYSKLWDGRKTNGVSAPSGIYFCKIQIDHQTLDVRKLMKIQ